MVSSNKKNLPLSFDTLDVCEYKIPPLSFVAMDICERKIQFNLLSFDAFDRLIDALGDH